MPKGNSIAKNDKNLEKFSTFSKEFSKFSRKKINFFLYFPFSNFADWSQKVQVITGVVITGNLPVIPGPKINYLVFRFFPFFRFFRFFRFFLRLFVRLFNFH